MFLLLVVSNIVSIFIQIIDWTQLEQKRSVVTFSSDNVLSGDEIDERENARESPADNRPRPTLVTCLQQLTFVINLYILFLWIGCPSR
jgi:hypothetical protein